MAALAVTEPPGLAQELADLAAKAARAAGAYVHTHFGGLLATDHKSRHSDVVTEYDRGAEELIRAVLLESFSDSTVIGEEFGGSDTGEIAWIVDPIDGTSNFAGGLPLYCISIGIVWRGRLVAGVIYDPERDELYSGTAAGLTLNGRSVESRAGAHDAACVCLMNFPYEAKPLGPLATARFHDALMGFRAVRRLGSAALALAWVASGRADAACEVMNPWDHAAGMALVLAGGGDLVALDRHGAASDPIWKADRYIAFGRGFSADRSALSGILSLPPIPESA